MNMAFFCHCWCSYPRPCRCSSPTNTAGQGTGGEQQQQRQHASLLLKVFTLVGIPKQRLCRCSSPANTASQGAVLPLLVFQSKAFAGVLHLQNTTSRSPVD